MNCPIRDLSARTRSEATSTAEPPLSIHPGAAPGARCARVLAAGALHAYAAGHILTPEADDPNRRRSTFSQLDVWAARGGNSAIHLLRRTGVRVTDQMWEPSSIGIPALTPDASGVGNRFPPMPGETLLFEARIEGAVAKLAGVELEPDLSGLGHVLGGNGCSVVGSVFNDGLQQLAVFVEDAVPATGKLRVVCGCR